MKRFLLTTLAALLLASLFTACSVRRTIRYSARAGGMIAGAFAVASLVDIVKEYNASDAQVTAAKLKAIEIVAALPEEQKAQLEKEPLLLVEVPKDDRADADSEATVVIFDTKNLEIVGDKAYDIKPNKKAVKKVKKNDLVQTEMDNFTVQYYGIFDL